MKRARIVGGSALVLSGVLAVDTPADLLQHARESVGVVLIVLPLLSLVVAVAELRRLAPPLVLIGVAIVAAYGIPSEIRNRWPWLAAVAGTSLVLSAATRAKAMGSLAIFWTTRPVLRNAMPARFRAITVIGTMSLDLRDTALMEDVVVRTTAVVAHVRLLVPAHWPVVLDGLPPSSVRLDERGRRDTIDRAKPKMRLRLDGAMSTVVLERW